MILFKIYLRYISHTPNTHTHTHSEEDDSRVWNVVLPPDSSDQDVESDVEDTNEKMFSDEETFEIAEDWMWMIVMTVKKCNLCSDPLERTVVFWWSSWSFPAPALEMYFHTINFGHHCRSKLHAIRETKPILGSTMRKSGFFFAFY